MEPRPAPLFQFHLSTAMVLMLLASVALARNILTYKEQTLETNPRVANRLWRVEWLCRGWPCVFERKQVAVFEILAFGERDVTKSCTLGNWRSQPALIGNVLWGLSLLIVVGCFSEWWLAHHPPKPTVGALRRRLGL
jgi:hypothetical protein